MQAAATDPGGTLDGPGGHWARKRSFPLLRGSDFRSLKVFLGFEGGTGPPPRAFYCRRTKTMRRIAGPLLAFALALANAPAHTQAGATPAAPDNRETSTASELHEPLAQPPTADDVCRALEQSAAENALPVEFFARVIWQESRFDAWAVSPRGHRASPNSCRGPLVGAGLPIRSIRSSRCGNSAAYLRDLLSRFGKLGLAAAYIAFASQKKRRLPSACPHSI